MPVYSITKKYPKICHEIDKGNQAETNYDMGGNNQVLRLN